MFLDTTSEDTQRDLYFLLMNQDAPPFHPTFFDSLPRAMVKKEDMDLSLFPFLGREGRDW